MYLLIHHFTIQNLERIQNKSLRITIPTAVYSVTATHFAQNRNIILFHATKPRASAGTPLPTVSLTVPSKTESQ